MKKFVLLSFLCIVCMILAVQAAAAETVTVTAAINPDSKPFKFINENGEIDGIDPEVIHAIGGLMDLDINLIPMDFDELLPAVANCEVDLAISAITWTEERGKNVLFSGPYAVGSQRIFVKSENSSAESLGSEQIKKVGVKAETTAEENVKKLAEEFGFEVVTYGYYGELFKMLENGEIDAAVSDDFLAKQFLDEYTDLTAIGGPVSREPYAIAICPTHPELLDKINYGLEELRNSGALDYIIQDYLG